MFKLFFRIGASNTRSRQDMILLLYFFYLFCASNEKYVNR